MGTTPQQSHGDTKKKALADTQRGPVVVLLSDDPSSTDEFDAKGHEAVARAIAELVEDEPGGKVIGLEGTWGSGKSTVVELLCDRLREDRKQVGGAEVRAIVFDAWAHQADPLRRTFLEKVIDELATACWLSSNGAAKHRQDLSGRISTVRTKSSARLSGEGVAASIAALLLPLGAVLLSNKFHEHHWAAQILGLICLLAPLLVVAGFFLIQRVAAWTGGRAKPATTRHRRLADLRPFSFFAKEQNTDTTTEGIERGEPTSVEFERIFSEVLDGALKPPRRLLLVLDNLDRVEQADAKTLLATMQTFTGSLNRRQPWESRVWTLIPYDPNGLDRLWEPDSAPREEADGAVSATATAFIEKLFQVRFKAPPLLLSDWRSYLLRLLSIALPTSSGAEKQAVVTIRALYPGPEPHGPVTAPPTPRQLKQFVNQIGALWRQREDIPLVNLAYFVLLQQSRIDVTKRLVTSEPTLPHSRLAHLLVADVGDDLLALHFGTTQGLANQIVLGNALDTAFASGDAAAIQPLIGRPGLVDTLESLDWATKAANGAIDLTRAVDVLLSSGAFDQAHIKNWSTAFLEPLAATVPSWSLAGAETGRGLAFLIDGLSTGDDAALANLLRKVDAKPQAFDENGQLQLDAFIALAEQLRLPSRGQSLGPVRDVLVSHGRRVELAIPPDRLVESLAYLATKAPNDAVWSALHLPIPAPDVADVFAGVAVSDNFQQVQQALDVLMVYPARVDLDALATKCLDWLRQQDPPSPEKLTCLLYVVDVARQAGRGQDAIGAAADDGTFMHLVSLSERQAWHVEAASASMLQLAVRPRFPEPQQGREAPSGTQILRETLTNPASHPDLVTAQFDWLVRRASEAEKLLIPVATTQEFVPWANQQFQRLEAAGTLLISPDQYLANWKYFRGLFEEDGFAQLVTRIFSDEKSRHAIVQGSQDPGIALATLRATQDKAYAASIRSWSKGIIEGSTGDSWRAALADPTCGDLPQLALQLVGTKEAPRNLPALQDALHTHFQSMAAGEAVWQPDGVEFEKLTELLAGHARRTLAGQLCAELEGRGGDIAPALFATYGTFLAGEKNFRIHAALPNVVERLVANSGWEGVAWFAEVAEHHRDAFQVKNREAQMASVRDRVTEKLAESGVGPPEALTRLADVLSIKWPVTPANDTEGRNH